MPHEDSETMMPVCVDGGLTPVLNALDEKLEPDTQITNYELAPLNDKSLTKVPQELEAQSVAEEASTDSAFEAPEEDVDDSDSDWSSSTPQGLFPEQVEVPAYTLLNQIGEGAFSKVFRAVPAAGSSRAFLCKNYRQLAVKVISKKQLNSHKNNDKSKATTKEQVLKEVAIHRTVSAGENVVSFVDFFESEHYFFIVQELLSGGEIFGEIVRLTYFSEDLSRHVIRQLALAVRHMHSLGVAHRDIKPENLLFDPIEFIPSPRRVFRKSDDPKTKEDEGVFRPGVGGGVIGTVKLADFGLSKQIYATNTKTPCGTVGYTAPEVVKDERYSTQVDMWGIGCVLYTMLCGFPPFYDEKIDVLTEKISRGEYTFLRPWWDEISDGAKYAVRRLLEVDPGKRYDIEEFLADPWLNNCDSLRTQEAAAAAAQADAGVDSKLKKHKNYSMENVHTSNKKKKHVHRAFKRDSSLLYSPAAVAMRDAFEVNNAVQRKEQVTRHTSTGVKLALLEENEEASLENDMFQLSINSSTILNRRKKREVPIAVEAAVGE
ncbi:LAMI_0A05358g1_1 [Lachancea mirantina]|uniref:non-specific serine/threonine protein kinase n=1 Tax=Lachancea mirantina TaxID=1230905 RepID=A0A1G4IPR7_9SACH|nr:LAMI_0A05358g1_1 [Lachancea mirantina]